MKNELYHQLEFYIHKLMVTQEINVMVKITNPVGDCIDNQVGNLVQDDLRVGEIVYSQIGSKPMDELRSMILRER